MVAPLVSRKIVAKGISVEVVFWKVVVIIDALMDVVMDGVIVDAR